MKTTLQAQLQVKFTREGTTNIKVRPIPSRQHQLSRNHTTYIPPYTEEDEIFANIIHHVNSTVIANAPINEALRKVGL
jgi:hypothetical protein